MVKISSRAKKILIIVAIANLIAIAFLIFIFIENSQKTATLDILVTPADSTITINGKSYNNGSYALKPGTYTAQISHADLDSQSIDIILTENHITKLQTYLSKNGDLSYYSSHDLDRSILAEMPNPEIQNFLQYQKLQDSLPYNYDQFSSDYSKHTWFTITKDDSKECAYFCLIIKDYTGGNLDLAKQKLTDLGFDISKCEIDYQYDELNNPSITGYSSK